MKDIWYADNRDLIKWGGMVHLCNTTGIKHVMQVAYFRESSWPPLYFDGKDIPILDLVTKHFRDIRDIRRLGKKAGLNIDVVRSEFSQNGREAYTEDVSRQIIKQPQRQIVFLDPDTGLAMQNVKAQHVESSEVSSIWQSLKRGDFLVLYQHRFRRIDWKALSRKQFAEACNIDESKVMEWRGPELARDVVFFFCEKQ